MRPAFSSTKQAALFALLLLVLLLSPVLAGKKFLPPHRAEYANQGWLHAPYPWIEHQIFEETNDIDIAFIGSSHILTGINTPYVQARLSAMLGRPASVCTFGWTYAGYDILYFVTRDLLAHRRVRMLVFSDEKPYSDFRNNQIPFRFGEDSGLLVGLPLHEQEFFYLSAIIGMPHNILSLCRPSRPASLLTATEGKPSEFVRQLGSELDERGFNSSPFVKFEPVTSARSTDVQMFSGEVKNNFAFSSAPLPDWQAYFASQFAQLLRTKNNLLPVMLYCPVLAETNLSVIPERTFWPDIFQTNLVMIGIPPAKMFGGLTETNITRLFMDPGHLNRNGQEYFTRLITPTLLQIYETYTNH